MPGPAQHHQLATCVVAVLLAASSCSASAQPTVDGVPVRNADAILERAEARPQQNSGVEVRCFFVSLDESTEILPMMRCGPAGPGGTRAGPWRVYGLEAADGGAAITLQISDDYREGWDLLPGERLHRPDGLAPLPEDHNEFSPPTGAFRFDNQLVYSVPLDFQTCMANAGFIVFGMEFLYDGQRTQRDNEIVTHISYVSHDSMTWNHEAGAAELAAKDMCVETVAVASGVGLEQDSGSIDGSFGE